MPTQELKTYLSFGVQITEIPSYDKLMKVLTNDVMIPLFIIKLSYCYVCLLTTDLLDSS